MMRTFQALLIALLLTSEPCLADTAKPSIPGHKPASPGHKPASIASTQATPPSQPPIPTPGEITDHQETHAGNGDDQSKIDLCGTDKSPLVVKILPNPQTNDIPTDKHDQSNEKPSHDWWSPEWSTVWVTVALAIIGTFQLWVFGRQARRLKETVEKMDEIAKNQDVLTGQSIALGRDQLNLTKTIERAFLSVEPDGIQRLHHLFPTIGQVVIKNTGRLPATNVRWWIDMRIDINRASRNFSLGEILVESNNIVAPGGNMRRFIDAKFEKEDIDVFYNAGSSISMTGALYIWGIVYYKDGLGKDRWIRFCHRYERDSAISSGEIFATRARQHQYGNGTDEDIQVE
jgi:hypothetical protein